MHIVLPEPFCHIVPLDEHTKKPRQFFYAALLHFLVVNHKPNNVANLNDRLRGIFDNHERLKVFDSAIDDESDDSFFTHPQGVGGVLAILISTGVLHSFVIFWGVLAPFPSSKIANKSIFSKLFIYVLFII